MEDQTKTRMLEKSYVIKYCKNTHHTFGRLNELFILDQCGPLFESPKFPRVYGVIKDRDSAKNAMLMDDLKHFGANTIPHLPGLQGLKFLKVVDSLAEF